MVFDGARHASEAAFGGDLCRHVARCKRDILNRVPIELKGGGRDSVVAQNSCGD